MNAYLIKLKNDFRELFPDARRYFGAVLVSGCLFGAAIVGLFAIYETNFAGLGESAVGALLPVLILVGIIAFVAGPDIPFFLRGEVNAASVRIVLRALVFMFGLVTGVFITLFLIMLLEIDIFR